MPKSELDRLLAALKSLPAKPADSEDSPVKKRYSEQMSAALAVCLADSLRRRGLRETRPAPPGELDSSGAERRIAGGIGDKKVDVTWSTDVAGLLLGLSIKTINFRDGRSKNYQKNFTNRRGDMLIEAVTLHRRFPYAVLGGLMVLDREAEHDGTLRRESTWLNAHAGLRLFTGRNDPAGRDEQFEHFYLGLVEATPFAASLRLAVAGEPDSEVSVDDVLERMLLTIFERNSDRYRLSDGRLKRRR